MNHELTLNHSERCKLREAQARMNGLTLPAQTAPTYPDFQVGLILLHSERAGFEIPMQYGSRRSASKEVRR